MGKVVIKVLQGSAVT